MSRLPFLHRRPFRRLVVAAQLVAFGLASVPPFLAHERVLWPLHVTLWAEIVLSLTMTALLVLGDGNGWFRLERRDERQRQSWIEAKAIACQVFLIAAWPLIFLFGISQPGFAIWAGLSVSRRTLLASALLIALPALPIAIYAWREPDLAGE